MLLSDFARPLGSKDKKPRKERSDKGQSRASRLVDIGKTGVAGAAGTANTLWLSKLIADNFPKKTESIRKKLPKNLIPRATLAGLTGGLTLGAVKDVLKRRKKQ